MKKLLLLLFLFLSCGRINNPQDDPDDIGIVISIADSYKIDLTKQTYTVYFIKGDSLEIEFTLDSREKNKIISKKNSLKYDRSLDRIWISDSCWIAPKLYTMLSIKSAGRINQISIDDGCDNFEIADKELAIQLEEFISLVKEIIYLKKEIKNAPESDWGYF